ncbi:hypothetical protein evm_013375 [Chilo suppressalis]|nr:hypothetical protein evm_013375 [Chilo suppressalis]
MLLSELFGTGSHHPRQCRSSGKLLFKNGTGPPISGPFSKLAPDRQCYRAILERTEDVYVNEKYLVYAKFSIKKYSRTSPYYLNIAGINKQPWTNNITVVINLKEKLSNMYKPSFLDFRFPLCDLVSNDHIFGTMLRQAGIRCPVPPQNEISPSPNIPATRAHAFPMDGIGRLGHDPPRGPSVDCEKESSSVRWWQPLCATTTIKLSTLCQWSLSHSSKSQNFKKTLLTSRKFSKSLCGHVNQSFKCDVASSGHFEQVHKDIVGPLPISNNNRYVATFIDRFTRWPEAIPEPEVTAKIVTKTFYNSWITRTTSYHPQANGMVERWHRIMKTAITARGNSIDWSRELPTILLGLRTTVRQDYDISPAQMVYGSNIRIPGIFLELRNRTCIITIDRLKPASIAQEGNDIKNASPAQICTESQGDDANSTPTYVTKSVNMETEPKQREDKLTQAIGEFGKWQCLLILLLSIPAKMSAIWTLLGIIFLAPKTQFRCIERNSTGDISNSTCYSDCERYEYFTDFEMTIISEWDLICERAWMVNFAQMMLMLGVLLGNIFFGFVADRYGRRLALLIASMMQLILSLVVPFSPNYWVFLALRLFLGASTAGIMAVTFVLVVEIVGSKKRELVTSLYHLPFALGQMILPLFSYYLRSWNKFSLGVGIPNLIFLLYIYLIPESPKWLISMGRLEEASQVMNKAIRDNNLPSQNTLEIAKRISSEEKIQSEKDKNAKMSYWILISHPTTWLSNLCSCAVWFCLGVSLYGGNQYVGQTSSNVFLSSILIGALQIPGITSSGYLFKRFGRKPAIIGLFLGCAMCNILLILPEDWFYLKLFAGAMAICWCVSAFTVMYTFTAELFPTIARNMALGASSTTSRVGSMVAPFIISFDQPVWLPPVVFAVVPLLAAGVVCCLPETKGKKLTDTLEVY